MPQVTGDLWWFENLAAGTWTPPSNSIGDSAIKTAAAIQPEKILNLHTHVENFGFDDDETPLAHKRCCFRARGAALVRYFAAWLEESGTSGVEINFDLLKGGVTMLSAVVDVVHGTGDGTLVVGAFSGTPTLADGDIIEIDLGVTATNDETGPRAIIEIEGVAN